MTPKPLKSWPFTCQRVPKRAVSFSFEDAVRFISILTEETVDQGSLLIVSDSTVRCFTIF
jgi:hypothetical protein